MPSCAANAGVYVWVIWSKRSLHQSPCPLPCVVPTEPYRDEAAVKVEALATALGHHDAGSEGPVGTSCQGKQQHVEAHEDGQAEHVAAVVVPVGRGQRTRSALVSLGSWRR